jgi:hypothetical protein
MFGKPFIKPHLIIRAVGYERGNALLPHTRQVLGYNARIPPRSMSGTSRASDGCTVLTKASQMRDLNREFQDSADRQYAYD